jgi:hypothetical protein
MGKLFIMLSLIEALRREKNENSVFLRDRYSVD